MALNGWIKSMDCSIYVFQPSQTHQLWLQNIQYTPFAWGTNTSRLGVPPPTSNSCSGLALSGGSGMAATYKLVTRKGVKKTLKNRRCLSISSVNKCHLPIHYKNIQKYSLWKTCHNWLHFKGLFRSSPASTPSNISSSSTGHDLRSPKGPQDHGRIPAAESQHFFLLIHLMLVHWFPKLIRFQIKSLKAGN